MMCGSEVYAFTDGDLPPIALPMIISELRPTEAWA